MATTRRCEERDHQDRVALLCSAERVGSLRCFPFFSAPDQSPLATLYRQSSNSYLITSEQVVLQRRLAAMFPEGLEP